MAVKELFDVRNLPGCYGSEVLAGRISEADAEAVRRLREAGAIIVGVTRAHEFGWGITTQHKTLGATRNPWDLVVSQYYWATRDVDWQPFRATVGGNLRRFWKYPLRVRRNVFALGANVARIFWKLEDVTFDFFVAYMLNYYPPNGRFYFDRSGSVGLDFLIRYENLQSDYASVCERIGLPHSQLPSLKTKSRPQRNHYTTYYDDRTRELVAKKYRQHIEHFGYHFEEP